MEQEYLALKAVRYWPQPGPASEHAGALQNQVSRALGLARVSRGSDDGCLAESRAARRTVGNRWTHRIQVPESQRCPAMPAASSEPSLGLDSAHEAASHPVASHPIVYPQMADVAPSPVGVSIDSPSNSPSRRTKIPSDCRFSNSARPSFEGHEARNQLVNRSGSGSSSIR